MSTILFLPFCLFTSFFFPSGEGLSSSRLSLLRRSSVTLFDTSNLDVSPRVSSVFGRLLVPSLTPTPQTSPASYRHGRHFSEPCPPGLTSLLESSSPGSPRRRSAPGEIPEVVVHPPVEEDEVDHLSCQDLTGKHSMWC